MQKILIVDDSEINREILAAMLEKTYEIDMAKDGTYRGGRRVKAGSKPDALADKIMKGAPAKRMELPDFTDDMTDFDQHGNGVLAIIEMREGDLMARPLSEIRTRGTAAQEVARENLGVEVDVVEHEPPITITADMPAGPVDEAEQPA